MMSVWTVVTGLFLTLALVGCDTRRYSGGPEDGGGIPSLCTSTRVCADRLDCEDGERCNTALPEPVCQAVRCGTLGSACSEADLCAGELVCIGSVCQEGSRAFALCIDGCERCDDTPECFAHCEDLQAMYEDVRPDAEASGCLAELDAALECLADAYCRDSIDCDLESYRLGECTP
jgi:hypothetical protein